MYCLEPKDAVFFTAIHDSKAATRDPDLTSRRFEREAASTISWAASTHYTAILPGSMSCSEMGGVSCR